MRGVFIYNMSSAPARSCTTTAATNRGGVKRENFLVLYSRLPLRQGSSERVELPRLGPAQACALPVGCLTGNAPVSGDLEEDPRHRIWAAGSRLQDAQDRLVEQRLLARRASAAPSTQPHRRDLVPRAAQHRRGSQLGEAEGHWHWQRDRHDRKQVRLSA